MKLFVILATLLVLTACAGCTDPTKPTASNFEDGLNHMFARQQSCSNYTAADFPRTVAFVNGHGDNLLDALAANGLVAKSQTSSATGQAQLVYTVTAAGMKSQFAGENPLNTRLQLFCFGNKRVDTISNFEMPDQNHVVRVYYTWTMKDVPSWAKDPAVRASWPYLANYFRPDPTGTLHKSEDSLKQTANGWRTPQDE